jgi:DNA-binding NarL/FixJ family response regulator
MAGGITAVIVDEHAAVAAGVRFWCARADPPIEVLDAGDRLVDVWTGPGALADVVILDLELAPQRRNLGELRRLVDRGRRVVVYSRHVDRETAGTCLAIGALAYLTKRAGERHLVPAVHAAARGLRYLAPPSGEARADDRRPRLSPRELEVLRAWFACSSKDLVGARLNISAKTVDTHIARVRVKYANVGRAASTKSDLVTRALDDGLVTVAELTDASGQPQCSNGLV